MRAAHERFFKRLEVLLRFDLRLLLFEGVDKDHVHPKTNG